MDWFHIHWRDVRKDQHVRARVRTYEWRKRVMQSLTGHKKVHRPLLWQLRVRSQQPRWGRSTHIQNTCLFSLNTKSVYRRYRMARSTLKTFVHKGWLSGVRKSSH